MLCVAAGGEVLALAVSLFTLSWTHSVERTEWRESWRAAGGRLQLVEAQVEGSGAGIDIPDGARMTAEGWVFSPALPPLSRLVLAASGMTPSGWMFCAGGTCRELGAAAGEPVEIWAAPACSAEAR